MNIPELRLCIKTLNRCLEHYNPVGIEFVLEYLKEDWDKKTKGKHKINNRYKRK